MNSKTANQIMDIQEHLKEKQTGTRFLHTLGVEYTSVCLAMKYGADQTKAGLAGLLHDCAKHMAPEKLLKICREHKMTISDAQLAQPCLLHGPAGAYLAREKYNVKDTDIFNAVFYHTTGRPAMSLLEKIVFVADYIEPARDRAPHLDDLRRISFEDLDRAVYITASQTLDYLKKQGNVIDPATQETCEYYERLVKGELS